MDMNKQLLKRRKLASSGLLIVLGLGTVMQSLEYTIGTASRMGPGYFPLSLGVLLLVFGVLIFVLPDDSQELALLGEPSDDTEEKSMSWGERVRPWIAIVASMLLFILVGKYGGLVPATFILILVAALGDKANSLKSSIFLAIGVTLAAVGLFHYGLQLQFPLFTWG